MSLFDFEIIVSDNDPDGSSEVLVQEFPYANFHYYHSSCIGFLNSIEVLKYGKGELLKLNNDYTQWKPGTLRSMIEMAKQLRDNKPVVFFTNAELKKRKQCDFGSFDIFMRELSYWSSWSTGFSIWRADFEGIVDKVAIDQWFPHTSLLLGLTEKREYILNDLPWFNDQKIKNKGGYNPYEVFGVRYLDMLRAKVSDNTFNSIKKAILEEYLASRWLKTVLLRMDKFEYDNIREHLRKYFGKHGYERMLLHAALYPIKRLV